MTRPSKHGMRKLEKRKEVEATIIEQKSHISVRSTLRLCYDDFTKGILKKRSLQNIWILNSETSIASKSTFLESDANVCLRHEQFLKTLKLLSK